MLSSAFVSIDRVAMSNSIVRDCERA